MFPNPDLILLKCGNSKQMSGPSGETKEVLSILFGQLTVVKMQNTESLFYFEVQSF